MRKILIIVLFASACGISEKEDQDNSNLLERKKQSQSVTGSFIPKTTLDTMYIVDDKYYSTVLSTYGGAEDGYYYKASYFSDRRIKEGIQYMELKSIVGIDSNDVKFENKTEFLNFMDSLNYAFEKEARINSYKTEFTFERKD